MSSGNHMIKAGNDMMNSGNGMMKLGNDMNGSGKHMMKPGNEMRRAGRHIMKAGREMAGKGRWMAIRSGWNSSRVRSLGCEGLAELWRGSGVDSGNKG